MKSVVLFSGGLDSTTVLAYALARGDTVYPLTILYGQRHAVEKEKAVQTLLKYGLSDIARELHIDLTFLKTCSLINQDLTVPVVSPAGIPSTYVPARNLIFLSIAAAYAEETGAQKILIGVNALDYSGYPDCRPEFIEAFNTTVKRGTRQGIENNLEVEAPLQRLSKAAIIQMGISLNVDYSLTHSCYNPDDKGTACGVCDSCRLRLKGFSEAGYSDPLPYLTRKK